MGRNREVKIACFFSRHHLKSLLHRTLERVIHSQHSWWTIRQLSKETVPCQDTSRQSGVPTENSPTCSPPGMLLQPFRFQSSIPKPRNANPGRARGAVAPSQVQHCGEKEKWNWVRPRVLLCAFYRKSQFPLSLLAGAHSYQEVKTHRLFKYLNLANTFNLST